MARPKFTPTDEQAQTLAALRQIGARRATIEQEVARLGAEADPLIAKAQQQHIPVLAVAEALKVTRKTVYRHRGQKMK